MWKKIKALFTKGQVEKEGWVSGLRFGESIKALGMEVYKGITIVYLVKPKKDILICKTVESIIDQPIYHFFHKKEFYYKEADTFEELQRLAQEDIDNLL